MSTDKDPRANRGSGNARSKAWYDSPFWKSVGPSARKEKETTVDIKPVQCDTDSVAVEPDEIKARMKRAFSMVY